MFLAIVAYRIYRQRLISRKESGKYTPAVSDTQGLSYESGRGEAQSPQVGLQTQAKVEQEATELEARSRAGSVSWQSRSVLEI